MTSREEQPRTIVSLLLSQREEKKSLGGLFIPSGSSWTRLGWDHLAAMIVQVSSGLQARGVGPGDFVGLWAPNSAVWVVLDLAIAAAGAVSVAFQTEWSAEQVASQAKRLGVKHMATTRAEDLGRLRDAGFHIRTGVALAASSLDELVEKLSCSSECNETQDRPSVRAGLGGRQPGADAAMIIFTSGTDGTPQAVLISHRAILELTESILKVYQPLEHQVTLCYLPLAHAIGRLIGLYLPIKVGASVYLSQGYEHVPGEIKRICPTIFFGVPRVWEKLLNALESTTTARFGLMRSVLIKLCMRFLGPACGLAPSSPRGTWKQTTANWIRAMVRHQIGLGRSTLLLSGGAPLNPTVQLSLHHMGLPVLEAYGQTESIVTTLSSPTQWKIGTVGKPLPGTMIKIGESNELCIKNSHLFTEYVCDKERTQRSFDSEGYFHTGDLVSIDGDGSLRIIGRKKALLVTSTGRKIAAAPLEKDLMSIRGVEHAVVVGEGRKYLTALLTHHDRPEHNGARLQSRAELTEIIRSELNRINSLRPIYERIQAFTLLSRPFAVETGELTPLGKVRRANICQRYASQIQAMYGES